MHIENPLFQLIIYKLLMGEKEVYPWSSSPINLQDFLGERSQFERHVSKVYNNSVEDI